MGQGRGDHVRARDELGTLASVVIKRIRPTRSDRETFEDCWQTAYSAGLQARNAAQRSHQPTSAHFLMLAMQAAVYRLIRRRKDLVYESDLQQCA